MQKLSTGNVEGAFGNVNFGGYLQGVLDAVDLGVKVDRGFILAEPALEGVRLVLRGPHGNDVILIDQARDHPSPSDRLGRFCELGEMSDVFFVFGHYTMLIRA